MSQGNYRPRQGLKGWRGSRSHLQDEWLLEGFSRGQTLLGSCFGQMALAVGWTMGGSREHGLDSRKVVSMIQSEMPGFVQPGVQVTRGNRLRHILEVNGSSLGM